MAKGTDRIVYRRPSGEWVEKSTTSGHAASVHKTQSAAIEAAHSTLERQGGGELITKGLDGRIRSKDTVSPGNDPCPPKDSEH